MEQENRAHTFSAVDNGRTFAAPAAEARFARVVLIDHDHNLPEALPEADENSCGDEMIPMEGYVSPILNLPEAMPEADDDSWGNEMIPWEGNHLLPIISAFNASLDVDFFEEEKHNHDLSVTSQGADGDKSFSTRSSSSSSSSSTSGGEKRSTRLRRKLALKADKYKVVAHSTMKYTIEAFGILLACV